MKKVKKGVKKAMKGPEVLQALSQSKYVDRVSIKKPTVTVNSKGCFEVKFEQTIADPTFEMITDLYVPLVQKIVMRATTHDFEFLYEGMDPNMLVTYDPHTKEFVTPEVKSWSELMGETEFFPCKWLQDPSNVLVRSPALTGGISTANIPVQRVSKPVPVRSTPVAVKASKSRKAQKISSSAVPTQRVVNAPSCSAVVNRQAIATDGAKVMHGREDYCSSVGMSGDGTTIKQPSLHIRGQITQLIAGKEVGPPLNPSMHISLPPKGEPSDDHDSGYPSIASTPMSGSPEPSIAATDKDDASVFSDSGVSTATNDTLCSLGSNTTLGDDMDMEES